MGDNMRVLFNVVLRIFIVLLLAGIIVVGVLVYEYYSTDETNIPSIEFKINNINIDITEQTWNTPVYGGLMYKAHTVQNDKVQHNVINDDDIIITYPADLNFSINITSPSGAQISAYEEPGTWKYKAIENGTYNYTVIIDKPQVDGEEYGTWQYFGSIEIDVQPSISISSTSAQQGDIISVRVSGIGELPMPEMSQDLSYAYFSKLDNEYIANIGIAHDAVPGNYNVSVTCGQLNVNETISVTLREFGRQDMTISSTTVANTSSAEDIAAYNEVVYSLFYTADEEIYWEGFFMLPVDTQEKNTEYGIFRYTNGSPVAVRHVGIDYDGDLGDNVYATNNGRVVYADFLNATGYTVVIEHGAGLKSYYYHLDELLCAQEDIVQIGDIIGKVGTTGYSTGPHLHFEMRIGREPIDPEKLFDGTSGLYLTQ